MLKKISCSLLKNKIEELIINSNIKLPKDVLIELLKFKNLELIKILLENNLIASTKKLPLCQDTGISYFFIEKGLVYFDDKKTIEEIINEAVTSVYSLNILRPSILSEPFIGSNTMNNTPAFIHLEENTSKDLIIKYLAKGGGSENLSKLFMFNPSDSFETIKNKILEHIKDNIINACPPVIIGIGLGGTADSALINSKKVFFRNIGERNLNSYYAQKELQLKEAINNLNIGIMGLKVGPTVLDVFIKEEAMHMATFPVAISVFCHAARRGTLIV